MSKMLVRILLVDMIDLEKINALVHVVFTIRLAIILVSRSHWTWLMIIVQIFVERIIWRTIYIKGMWWEFIHDGLSYFNLSFQYANRIVLQISLNTQNRVFNLQNMKWGYVQWKMHNIAILQMIIFKYG